MDTVADLVIEREVALVKEIAEHRRWAFERVGHCCFRLSLMAANGDRYQLEVKLDGYPIEPAAFHWRNSQSGVLDDLADSPAPFGYFHGTGQICAPWNRLASIQTGPHPEWQSTGWQEHPATQGTTNLLAMVLRISSELKSEQYQGRRRC